MLLSGSLVRAFSGKQLVPEVLTNGLRFLLAVGLGAAMMVMLATHALTGALVGAGLMAIGSVHLARLGTSFFLPLGLSPLLSLLLVAGAYPALRAARLRMGVERQMCLCIGGEEPEPVQLQVGGDAVLQSSGLTIGVGQMESCMERYQGRFIGVDAQWILGRLHFLSAVAVGFARGLNDVTKIVALLITASGLGVSLGSSLLAVGVGMSIG